MARKYDINLTIANSQPTQALLTATEQQDQVGAQFMAAVLLVLQRVMKSKNISKADLARRLGITESTVSRQLEKSANLTTKTVGKYFWATDDVPTFSSWDYANLVNQGMAQDVGKLSIKYGWRGDVVGTGAREVVFQLERASKAASGGASVTFEGR